MRKGDFKCYKCRKMFAAKEGDWHNWDNMQVHLCRNCERDTRAAPERKK